MLHGYPAEATADNWLHDCLDAMVREIHSRIAGGVTAIDWPQIVPQQRRGRLRLRHGLSDRLQAYATALNALSIPERDRVLSALTQQNDFVNLLSCASNCESISALPAGIRAPARELFGFCFGLLTALGIRDQHYKIVWERTNQHVCPFCGCEFFDAPGAPREDDDHFLAESHYPFAAANLRNLVPMGAKCNQRYKHAADILVAQNGARRRAFYPYNHGSITISLDASEPFAADDGRSTKWVIDLIPPSPECETWDQVFSIRERYRRDILDPHYTEWLRPLAAWWKKEIHTIPVTDAVLVDGVARYVSHLVAMEMSGRDFLRAPMFAMLHKRCAGGEQRLISFLRRVVTP